jgi:hypothetical protein
MKQPTREGRQPENCGGHRCDTLVAIVLTSYKAGSSTLDHFNCINLILAERAPYRLSVFKVWAYECCVRFLLDFFAAFIEVPPKECQNANCFGGSLVNVVVPVEVIP